jgi:outer membrane protein TolC
MIRCLGTTATLAFAVLAWSTLRAAEPLPDPLGLEQALALAIPSLPAVELALAERDARAAALGEVEALSGVRLDAVGRLRAVRPSSVSSDRGNNDNSARIALRKRLYDFGYSESREEAARLAGDGSEWRLLQARQRARLAIMRSFFDVMLADLQFARDNEAMAGAFIDFDRAGDRHELNTVSDVDLLELEAAYQVALQARNESQQLQRAARSKLALAMGRPGELVAEVLRPESPDVERPIADYEALWADILAGNPELKALAAEVRAAEAGVEAARAGHGPVLSGELEAAAYNRKTNSTHPLGAALILEVPLLTGGAKDAAIASARAALRTSRARLTAHEHRLRQVVLELWQRLAALRTRLNGLGVRGDYRELYLDRSRALYELEVKTDLGDAMTEISALRLDVAEAEFDWIMVQARLDALAGRLLPGGSER